MQIIKAPVKETVELDNQIFLLKIYSPEISGSIKPGQFLNIRVTDSQYPLLRRPFSVCDVEGDYFYLMFNVFGRGTKILAGKSKGELIDILGPLGNGFNLEGDYETAIIAAGGLGVAPFPYLIRKINDKKKIKCFIGGKNKKDIIVHGMENILTSTDDGSLGMQGTVVDLLEKNLSELKKGKIKIFACGPNSMLRALKDFTETNGFDCEVSTECAMACGFGICQGCPIESTNDSSKYLLVCKDGPVFNVKDVVI